MRMRLQLCPDPPFVARCTLTLLGQPKAELSCVPLTRKGLNIMNLPYEPFFVVFEHRICFSISNRCAGSAGPHTRSIMHLEVVI